MAELPKCVNNALNQRHQSGVMTHMPFLTEEVLWFCQAEPSGRNRLWKIHFQLPDGSIHRLATGLPADAIECAPTSWHDAQGWHISYVAGGMQSNRRWWLYRADVAHLTDALDPIAVLPSMAGFLYRDRLVYAEKENIIHVRQPANNFDIDMPGSQINRVSYRADDTDALLISAVANLDDLFTLEYNLRTGQQHLLECDGQPAYKCTILGDRILYANRHGDGFEDRHIMEAATVVRRPTTLMQRVQ